MGWESLYGFARFIDEGLTAPMLSRGRVERQGRFKGSLDGNYIGTVLHTHVTEGSGDSVQGMEQVADACENAGIVSVVLLTDHDPEYGVVERELDLARQLKDRVKFIVGAEFSTVYGKDNELTGGPHVIFAPFDENGTLEFMQTHYDEFVERGARNPTAEELSDLIYISGIGFPIIPHPSPSDGLQEVESHHGYGWRMAPSTVKSILRSGVRGRQILPVATANSIMPNSNSLSLDISQDLKDVYAHRDVRKVVEADAHHTADLHGAVMYMESLPGDTISGTWLYNLLQGNKYSTFYADTHNPVGRHIVPATAPAGKNWHLLTHGLRLKSLGV
ncbi:MAG: hypothetical protein HY362_02935 [Candidatus Aenigmarchaeota archaeon]|nr:hypothetical protein [Candidatus Aenigmarchaeota archaeon]